MPLECPRPVAPKRTASKSLAIIGDDTGCIPPHPMNYESRKMPSCFNKRSINDSDYPTVGRMLPPISWSETHPVKHRHASSHRDPRTKSAVILEEGNRSTAFGFIHCSTLPQRDDGGKAVRLTDRAGGPPTVAPNGARFDSPGRQPWETHRNMP